MHAFRNPVVRTSHANSMAHNTRIAEAITDLKRQDRPNIAATARKYGVDRSTLSRRFRGETGTIQDATSYSRKQLTTTQEETLIEYVNKLNDRGFPPTPQILKNIAESIAKTHLGHNWVARFCKRHHTRLASVYLRTIDHKRKLADNSHHFQYFFDLVRLFLVCVSQAYLIMYQLRQKLDQYDIQAQNIYNVDEKGFLIGFSRTKKRIVSVEGLKSKRIAGASQDGNREFITLIAAICADGSSLPPSLIYQGQSYDLQDTWLDGFDDIAHRAFFACSKNGWSDDSLGLDWLRQVFDRTTKEKTSLRDRRLLIVDGHNSHVNIPFIEYADTNRILLAVFPPHSTHRLQPLDIGLFAPLATYYSHAIDRLLSESQGLVRLTKRDFWPLFYEAWQKAFHAKNVRSAWEAAGLYPLNPKRVISTVVRQQTPPDEQQSQSQSYKTPGSTRSLRRTFRRLQDEGKIHPDAAVLLRAGEKLATNLDIVRHEVVGLRKAVLHEKQRRKRGKAMHLYDEGETEGQARFFSPTKVARARERIAIAEDTQHQRQLAVQDKKLQMAISRAEKAREAQERREQRQLARQAVREQLASEKVQRQAVREARRVQKAAEVAKRKQDVEEKRAQRIRAKEQKKAAVQSKKRSLEQDEVDQPQKRARTTAFRMRYASNSRVSSTKSDSAMTQRTTDRISQAREGLGVVDEAMKVDGPISHSERSGRTIRLPTRFR
jgi:DDE superfamily endonuclease/Tc5 transposase DNA-binding domain